MADCEVDADRTMTLTCECGARNERRLPYDMLLPDKCYACERPFPRAAREPCPYCPPGTAFRRGDPNCSCGGTAVVIARPADQWIQTYTGRQYWPLEPRASDVCVEDIAHHLGYICRFSGACTRFYSVAEHSTHVSCVVEAVLADRGEDNPAFVLRAHLHDAAEYVPPHDVARPVKYSGKCDGLRDIETANAMAIFRALGLPYCDREGNALVKEADDAMLLAEQEAIMRPSPAPWVAMDVPARTLEHARRRMALAKLGFGGSASPDRAGEVWLDRYRSLTT
jgi:hypothetical protein